jgi:hypothetical protein
LTNPITRVLMAIDQYTGEGPHYRTKCPVHGGHRRDSLSITERDDGSVQLHPFCGCEKSAILQALGLAWPDLFPTRTDAHGRRVIQRPAPQHAWNDVGEGHYRLDPIGWGEAMRFVESLLAQEAPDRSKSKERFGGLRTIAVRALLVYGTPDHPRPFQTIAAAEVASWRK